MATIIREVKDESGRFAGIEVLHNNLPYHFRRDQNAPRGQLMDEKLNKRTVYDSEDTDEVDDG